ncbi:CCHC-type domain-containing protein [Trichonephila clavata]|uniref:CCHC-type domain-containing protein n=1 Tax=Trichonephila clavata TaxID=2740835 RepID=A0A8X6J2M0_TRICU|nr:CCHC-type domain-containing protein [Trichonephila clavata]
MPYNSSVSDEWSGDLKTTKEIPVVFKCRDSICVEALWEKKSDSNFSSRKNFDKPKVAEIKEFTCFTCGSDKHFKRDCPKNKGIDNKRLNVNKVSTEGMELEDGTVAARVDLLGKVIPRRDIEEN